MRPFTPPLARSRWLLATGAALGFVAVACGAFGAHALRDWFLSLPDGDARQAWWQTASQYQMWHALVVVVAGLWQRDDSAPRAVFWAGAAAVAGIVLFSGSLYAMALSGVRALGAVTPLGGVFFLGAWSCLLWAGLRSHGRARP